jgi:hypothetical protein
VDQNLPQTRPRPRVNSPGYTVRFGQVSGQKPPISRAQAMRQRSRDNWSMYRIQEAPVRIEKNWMRVSDVSGLEAAGA